MRALQPSPGPPAYAAAVASEAASEPAPFQPQQPPPPQPQPEEMHTPIPDLPAHFPQLELMDLAQLQRLQKDDIAMTAFFEV
jgi:hypothetical protein